jgi:hypothetical protein
MPLPRRRRPAPQVLACIGVVLLLGCEETVVPIVGIAHPTLVEISPDAFLDSVPCLDAPGAMRRYVATVFDVNPTGTASSSDGGGGESSTDDDFALPSSTIDSGDGVARPIPCRQGVAFSRIVPGHRYRAEIDGYDRDDLQALEPGLRILIDPVTSERVAKRWAWSCAEKTPVTGLAEITRSIGSCELLSDAAPGGETLVEVRVDGALLGLGLECGSEPGAVDRFEVTSPDGTTSSAICGEAVVLSELEPGRATVTLPLRAFQAGLSEPTWGTSCLAQVVEGVTTTATCTPLVDAGALEVDPEDVVAALGLRCEPLAFVELDVEMTDEPPDARRVRPSECGGLMTFQDRAPGAATARATASFTDGSESGAVLCTGTIVPGDTVRATCATAP